MQNGAVALIAARGGSKGIPRKNLISFCGKPLLVWSIESAMGAKLIESVWVTSDDDEILAVAERHGAKGIRRPSEFASDTATSEVAWLHALDFLRTKGIEPDVVVAIQPTSPLRECSDVDRAVETFRAEKFDSAISGAKIGDFYIWKKTAEGVWDSLNYDYRNRKRRQDFSVQMVENGSMYLFTPELLRNTGNRLGGKIGICEMEFWKSFEIDDRESLRLCEVLMQSYLLNGGGTET